MASAALAFATLAFAALAAVNRFEVVDMGARLVRSGSPPWAAAVHHSRETGVRDCDRRAAPAVFPTPSKIEGDGVVAVSPRVAHSRRIRRAPSPKSEHDKSWEITEPAIYYQSAYIKLLSNERHRETKRSLIAGR
jgi:hypothetical protein